MSTIKAVAKGMPALTNGEGQRLPAENLLLSPNRQK